MAFQLAPDTAAQDIRRADGLTAPASPDWGLRGFVADQTAV
jgi:hypothetical protein